MQSSSSSSIGSVLIVATPPRPEVEVSAPAGVRSQRSDKGPDDTISEPLRRPDDPEYISRSPDNAAGDTDNSSDPHDFRQILEKRIASDSQDRSDREEQSDCEEQRKTSAKTDKDESKKPASGVITRVIPPKPVPGQTTVVPGIKANAGKSGSGDNVEVVSGKKTANSAGTEKIVAGSGTATFAGAAEAIKAAETGESRTVATPGTTAKSPSFTGIPGAAKAVKAPNTSDSSPKKMPTDAAQAYGNLQKQDKNSENSTVKAQPGDTDILKKSHPTVQVGPKTTQTTDMKQGAGMKKEHTADGMLNKANTPVRTAPASNSQAVVSDRKPAQPTNTVLPNGIAAVAGNAGDAGDGNNNRISPSGSGANLEMSLGQRKGGLKAPGKTSRPSDGKGFDPAESKEIQKLADNLAERLASRAQDGLALAEGAVKSIADSVVAVSPLRTVSGSTQTASSQQIGIRSIDSVGTGQTLDSRNTAAIGPHQQVMEHININLRNPDQRITITLNPPELGKVSIRFQRSNGEITGIIEVEKIQTRYDIERHLPQVMMSMENSGLQVRRIQVTTSDQQQDGNHRNATADDSAADYQQHRPDAQPRHNSPEQSLRSGPGGLTDPAAQGKFATEQAHSESQISDNAINVYI